MGHSVAMSSRRAQMVRLRQIALAALSHYPLPEGRLLFISHGENTTFRHDSGAGSYLVRVHRPQRHGRNVDSTAAIASEIAWLRAIRADTDLAVPEAILARDGAPTVTATAAGQTRICSVLRWMEGRIYETSARPVHLSRLGRAMGQLHDHADAWTPPPDFVRIRWDYETFFGDVMGMATPRPPDAGRSYRLRSVAASRRWRPGWPTSCRASATSASSTPICTSATRSSSAAGSS